MVYDFTPNDNTEIIHWKIMTGTINKEFVRIDGIEESVQGLYAGYEQELDYYAINGVLPYDIKKEVIEGENIPIDTNITNTASSNKYIN